MTCVLRVDFVKSFLNVMLQLKSVKIYLILCEIVWYFLFWKRLVAQEIYKRCQNVLRESVIIITKLKRSSTSATTLELSIQEGV